MQSLINLDISWTSGLLISPPYLMVDSTACSEIVIFPSFLKVVSWTSTKKVWFSSSKTIFADFIFFHSFFNLLILATNLLPCKNLPSCLLIVASINCDAFIFEPLFYFLKQKVPSARKVPFDWSNLCPRLVWCVMQNACGRYLCFDFIVVNLATTISYHKL